MSVSTSILLWMKCIMICIHNLVYLGFVCPTPTALLANVFSYLAMLVMLRRIRFLKMRDSKKHSQFVKCYMVNGILRVSTIQNRMHYYDSQHPNASFFHAQQQKIRAFMVYLFLLTIVWLNHYMSGLQNSFQSHTICNPIKILSTQRIAINL